ncbi:MAG: hypothetical protein ABS99_00575 [Acetobacteraceae bacterium SCN 69-10]|nr:MAG: hypothetical protein ABS99_00575 [Acetobacteraceae bacterium SCN 69-10]
MASFIAGELMGAIEQGHYKPGTRLVEAEIAQRFGVSRAPVREALRMLMKDDLVMRRPRRGTVVTELSAAEVSEMYEVRSALYAAVVRLFVRRASDGEVAGYAVWRQHINDLAADATVTPARFVDATQAASIYVVERCGNARLQAGFRKMTRQSYRYYAEMAHGTVAHRRELACLATAMLEAMQARDAEAASMLAWRISESNHAAALVAIAAQEKPG